MNALDEDLCRRLARVLGRGLPRWRDAVLEPLPDTGLAHSHVRLVGHGVLARVPKQSQMALSPVGNLAYQAACFERAAAGGHNRNPVVRVVLEAYELASGPRHVVLRLT